MNGRSLQVQEWISTQIEVTQGMLQQSLTADYPRARLVCSRKPLFMQLRAKVLSKRSFTVSPHVVSVTSGFSVWFCVETPPLQFCGCGLSWKIQMFWPAALKMLNAYCVLCRQRYVPCRGTHHPACPLKPTQFFKA